MFILDPLGSVRLFSASHPTIALPTARIYRKIEIFKLNSNTSKRNLSPLRVIELSSHNCKVKYAEFFKFRLTRSDFVIQ